MTTAVKMTKNAATTTRTNNNSNDASYSLFFSRGAACRPNEYYTSTTRPTKILNKEIIKGTYFGVRMMFRAPLRAGSTRSTPPRAEKPSTLVAPRKPPQHQTLRPPFHRYISISILHCSISVLVHSSSISLDSLARLPTQPTFSVVP